MTKHTDKIRQHKWYWAAGIGLFILMTTSSIMMMKKEILEGPTQVPTEASQLTAEELLDIDDVPAIFEATPIETAPEAALEALPAVEEVDPNNGDAGHKPSLWQSIFGKGKEVQPPVEPIVTFPDTFVAAEVLEGMHGGDESTICTYMDGVTLHITLCVPEEVLKDGVTGQE